MEADEFHQYYSCIITNNYNIRISNRVNIIFVAIDYDSATQSYSFDVTVSDSSRSTTVGIIVAVTAVNEHTPSFTDVTSTVAENLAVGTSITVFTAIDIDYSPHDITSYTISSGESMVWCMVFNATFNNNSVISWRSVLLVEETRVPGEYHRPAASH